MGTGGRILGIVSIYIYTTIYIYIYIHTVQRFPVPFHTYILTRSHTYIHYLFLFDIYSSIYESSLSVSQFNSLDPLSYIRYYSVSTLFYSTLLYSTLPVHTTLPNIFYIVQY